jgi:hypothetical protein
MTAVVTGPVVVAGGVVAGVLVLVINNCLLLPGTREVVAGIVLAGVVGLDAKVAGIVVPGGVVAGGVVTRVHDWTVSPADIPQRCM